jgi:hypothetical protein
MATRGPRSRSRSRSRGRPAVDAPVDAPVATESRLKKIAKNGYVQFTAATLVTASVGVATGEASATIGQFLGTTGVVTVVFGAVVATAKGVKAVYNNATMENIKAVPAAAVSKVKNGLSTAWSYVPSFRRQAAAPVNAPVADEQQPAPTRRSSRRRSNRA